MRVAASSASLTLAHTMDAPAPRAFNNISKRFQGDFKHITELDRVLPRVRVGVDGHDVAATGARDHDASETNAAAAKDGDELAWGRAEGRW
jgi:hypothetical protein